MYVLLSAIARTSNTDLRGGDEKHPPAVATTQRQTQWRCQIHQRVASVGVRVCGDWGSQLARSVVGWMARETRDPTHSEKACVCSTKTPSRSTLGRAGPLDSRSCPHMWLTLFASWRSHLWLRDFFGLFLVENTDGCKDENHQRSSGENRQEDENTQTALLATLVCHLFFDCSFYSWMS